ncbi:Crp/Fnr family transcriptional regulator [Sphingomonas sp. BIUV-7]|uniref:Crp/Fnr family transcriptional regulator n=1 Tax=Sphingomonas natans TaxID=3063330 RepID=A0ABT8Y9Z2_9SPHN|nr:Crp/Fnr family transcriptional regulator [Sphingomonas sp. BIUV-7]MDO6415161.1 Crp/Fnr family transcriptional regulator [Sphingomonas sp. BIUV-7]
MSQAFLAKILSAGDLSPADQSLVLRLLDDVRTVAARRDIIRDGERPDHVHVMIEGWACRYKVLRAGPRQITAFLLPGDFCDTHVTIFNEMDHGIAAISESRVAYVPRGRMLELTERPGIARAFWWASLVDEAVLRAWIVNLGRRDAFDRVGHLICELHARLHNVGLADDGTFDMPLTQEELSDALGLTPVHVNRVLKRLREEGLMSFRRRQITISDIAALRAATDFDPIYLHLSKQRVPVPTA